MGRGGARAGPCRGQADPALDRLRRLSLVPRHGARELRGRRDRRADEPALRLDQGRPGGAPRPGRDLHGRRPGDDRRRRMAPHRVPDPGGQTVLRRHLLPERGAPRPPRLPDGPVGHRGRVGQPPLRGRAAELEGHRGDRAVDRPRCLPAAAHRGDPRDGLRRAAPGVRPALGRVRRRAEVPPTHDPGVLPAHAPARDTRRARRGDDHAGQDGRRRDVRPGGRRLPSVLDGRTMARPTLREDAVRQRAAGPSVRARVAGDRPRALPPGRHRNLRVPAPRAPTRRGGLLLLPGRG